MDWLQSFDPDPQWYVWTLHTITIISIPIYILGMICILCVNISSNSSFYKLLLAVNITMSYLTQLSLSVGTVPVLVLPAPGGFPLGLLPKIGVSTCFQTAAVINLLAGNGMLTVVLFFYRSHVVMPLRIMFNYLLVAYGILMTIVIPLILNTFVCQTNDSSKAKDNFQKECFNMFALLPSQAANVLLILDTDILLYFVLYFYVVLVFQAIFWIGIFVYRITAMLRRHITSKSAIVMHRSVVRCLLIQTAIYYGLFLVPLFSMIVALCIKAVLPTAANLAFIVISLSDPAGVLAMVLAHKKYRTAVMRLFHKEKKASGHISIASLKKGAFRQCPNQDENGTPTVARRPE